MSPRLSPNWVGLLLLVGCGESGGTAKEFDTGTGVDTAGEGPGN